MSRSTSLALAIACAALLAAEARAVSFGPFPVSDPSSIRNGDGSISVVPSGTLTFDIAHVPYASPQVFRITDVHVTAGSLAFGLDPTLASPALGVLQLDGTFLVPTLFLVGNDGTSDFDLAIPDLTGHLLGAPGSPSGLFTAFQVDSGHDLFDVSLTFAVPEPGTALLTSLGFAALACRRKEIPR